MKKALFAAAFLSLFSPFAVIATIIVEMNLVLPLLLFSGKFFLRDSHVNLFRSAFRIVAIPF